MQHGFPSGTKPDSSLVSTESGESGSGFRRRIGTGFRRHRVGFTGRLLFDPDFIEVGASGRRWTHAEMVAALPTLHGGAENSTPITAEHFEVTVLASGIVHLTYETRIEDRHARRSSIWRRDAAGEFRLYYHQATPVPDGTARP